MHDLFEDSEQQLQVRVERETASHVTGTLTQPGVSLRITKSVDNRVSQALDCWRIARRHDTVDIGFEPLRHATDIERHRRKTEANRLETRQGQRLRPQTWKGEEIRSAIQIFERGAAHPAEEFDFDARVLLVYACGEAFPGHALRSFAGE